MKFIKNWAIASVVGFIAGLSNLVFLIVSDISWKASASGIVMLIFGIITLFYLELKDYAKQWTKYVKDEVNE